MNRVLVAVVVLAYGCLQSCAEAYYRVSASTNSVILGLTPSGMLSWSNSAAAGSYLVERTKTISPLAWTPWTKGSFYSSIWQLKVDDPAPPEGMCFIPGGTFLMGDSQNDTNVYAVANPVHTVTVSPFFMDRYEFTNERMRAVLQWAFDNAMISVITNTVLLADGSSTNVLVALGKLEAELYFSNNTFTVRQGRENYPAEFVSWYGAASCCNFLSAMTDKEPCYDLADWTCDFSKNGYRLPTEAEWEFAARGGYEGLRFPWANTNVITHANANYYSDTNNWYDVSPTRGFHPDYSNAVPHSSPVGSFAPNNYGLFDMSGNTWEWTWDWHARYTAGAQINPTGPATGTYKIMRGGSWFTKAERLTCAMRYTSIKPSTVFSDIGFRTVLPYSQ